jgi:ubiquinone/menaquinone biosynthesis C-methylase UbiE
MFVRVGSLVNSERSGIMRARRGVRKKLTQFKGTTQMTDQFNTDTNALESRARINTRGATHDLEEWIIGLLPPLRGSKVLDLGCGTGKQIFRLAPLVSDAGRIVGIDLSEDAVRAVNQRAKDEHLQSVEARQMGLDACLDYLADERFDLIISSYAIYYAQDIVALLKGLRSLLTDQGVVFVCGPGSGTNGEIHDMINGLAGSGTEPLDPVADFLCLAQTKEIASKYSQSAVSRLANHVCFDSVDRVLSWWTHHNSFVSSLADKVEDAVRAHFETHATFNLTKNVLGVRFDA